MKRITLAVILLLVPVAMFGQGIIHGNGVPTDQNCAFSRMYVDDSTQKLYFAVTGSPCVWTDAGTIGGGMADPGSNGILKRTALNTTAVAVSGTDYQAPISLTTTGTSGAATLVGGTLNIPQYTGGGISGLTTNTIPKATSSTAIGNSLLSDDGTTLSYTGTGGASVDHITTTGTASAMTTTAVADGTTANSFWLSSTTANRWKTYVGAALQVFAYQSDGLNVFAAGAIANGSTATTQSDNDNSTKLATTAYVDGHAVAAAKIPAVSVVVDISTPITVSTTLNAEMHFNEHATTAQAMVYNLPTAAAGKQFCFANANNGSAANTGTVKLVPSATGQYIIFTDGTLTTNTTGYVISGGAAGDAGCVVGVDSTHWMLYVQRGTWTKA